MQNPLLGHDVAGVPAGHRLRVVVASAAFPKYDRNPGITREVNQRSMSYL
jgi:predicted acyl esterase